MHVTHAAALIMTHVCKYTHYVQVALFSKKFPGPLNADEQIGIPETLSPQ